MIWRKKITSLNKQRKKDSKITKIAKQNKFSVTKKKKKKKKKDYWAQKKKEAEIEMCQKKKWNN